MRKNNWIRGRRGTKPIEEVLPESGVQLETKKGNGCALVSFILMGVFTLTPFLAYYFWHFGKTGDLAEHKHAGRN